MPLIMTLHLHSPTVDPETGLAQVAATIDLSALDALTRLDVETATLKPVPGDGSKIAIHFEGEARLASLRVPSDKETREQVLSPCRVMLQVIDHHLQSYAKYLRRGE